MVEQPDEPGGAPQAELTVSPITVARVLLAAVLVVVALDALTALAIGLGARVPDPVAWRLDSDSEMSIPTLVNVVLLVIAAGVSALAGVLATVRRYAWGLLSLAFLGLAIDDLSMIHEGLNQHLQPVGFSAMPTYAWLIPYLAAATVLGLLLFPLLRGLPSRTRMGLVAAALVFLGGAAGLELAGAWFLSPENPVLTAVEEALEMAGIVIFIYFVLDYLAAGENGLRIHVQRTPGSSRVASARGRR